MARKISEFYIRTYKKRTPSTKTWMSQNITLPEKQ